MLLLWFASSLFFLCLNSSLLALDSNLNPEICKLDFQNSHWSICCPIDMSQTSYVCGTWPHLLWYFFLLWNPLDLGSGPINLVSVLGREQALFFQPWVEASALDVNPGRLYLLLLLSFLSQFILQSWRGSRPQGFLYMSSYITAFIMIFCYLIWLLFISLFRITDPMREVSPSPLWCAVFSWS